MTAPPGEFARSKSRNNASTTFSFVSLIAHKLNEKMPRKANKRFLRIRDQRSPMASFLLRLVDRPSNRMSEIKIGKRERTRLARSNRRRRFQRHARSAPFHHWVEPGADG